MFGSLGMKAVLQLAYPGGGRDERRCGPEPRCLTGLPPRGMAAGAAPRAGEGQWDEARRWVSKLLMGFVCFSPWRAKSGVNGPIPPREEV